MPKEIEIFPVNARFVTEYHVDSELPKEGMRFTDKDGDSVFVLMPRAAAHSFINQWADFLAGDPVKGDNSVN
ncbi:MAG: hypothetical protein AAGM33_11715 [Pseudomonadota bacterium]